MSYITVEVDVNLDDVINPENVTSYLKHLRQLDDKTFAEIAKNTGLDCLRETTVERLVTTLDRFGVKAMLEELADMASKENFHNKYIVENHIKELS